MEINVWYDPNARDVLARIAPGWRWQVIDDDYVAASGIVRNSGRPFGHRKVAIKRARSTAKKLSLAHREEFVSVETHDALMRRIEKLEQEVMA
jgi:hypothetical protein